MVRFHQATQFNSSFMNFECIPSQPKQSPYFKFMGHPVLRVNIKIEGVLYPENAEEKMTQCPHKMIIIIT